MKQMRVLLTIPHVFSPKKNSLYSSENESKRAVKQNALRMATLENLRRHQNQHWIHASLGKGKPIVTRRLETPMGVDLTIELYSPNSASLTNTLSNDKRLKIIDTNIEDYSEVPAIASRRALEQASKYDLIGYLEDDILIEDTEFFAKIAQLINITGGDYAFIPHRCEQIPGKGDVILSGDPDGGRPDLFWATGETIQIAWPLGLRSFYRATNPHSGCYFLSQRQALKVLNYWQSRNWQSNFQLSGPLEQACSGMLLPVLKLMKPTPENYRFLMVRHQDQLWQRHPFESPESIQNT